MKSPKFVPPKGTFTLFRVSSGGSANNGQVQYFPAANAQHALDMLSIRRGKAIPAGASDCVADFGYSKYRDVLKHFGETWYVENGTIYFYLINLKSAIREAIMNKAYH